MASDVPAFLEVGTPVSAKFKGAFCEATIKKIKKLVKCKVVFKVGLGSVVVNSERIIGDLVLNAVVQVKQEDGELREGLLQKMNDHSLYTVVFDDGDERTLRRTNVCVMGEKHFSEHENLDNLPLTDPENFLSPVLLGTGDKRRKRTRPPTTVDDDDSDSDKSSKRLTEVDKEYLGKVVCIEQGERKKTWFPALGLKNYTGQPENHVYVQSFKDGKKMFVQKEDVKEFNKNKEPLTSYFKGEIKIEPILRSSIDKALAYNDFGELPKGWNILDTIDEKESSDEDGSAQVISSDLPLESKTFHEMIYSFMSRQGMPITKDPVINSQSVDLYKLFNIVADLGGMEEINNAQWRSIYTQLGLQNIHSAASFSIKALYKRTLLPYELYMKNPGKSSPATQGRQKLKRSPKDILKDDADHSSVVSESDSEPDRRRSTRSSKNNGNDKYEGLEGKKRQSVLASIDSGEEASDKNSIGREFSEQDIDVKSEAEDVDVVNSPQSSMTSEDNDSRVIDSGGVQIGKYKPGSRIAVHYGSKENHRLYNAKILEVEKEPNGEVVYFVHYNGWNHRYDEWIKDERIHGPSTTGPGKRKNGPPPTPLSKIRKDPPKKFQAKIDSDTALPLVPPSKKSTPDIETLKVSKSPAHISEKTYPMKSPVYIPENIPDQLPMVKPVQPTKQSHRPKPVNEALLFIPDIKPSPVKPRLTRNSMQDTFLLNALEESIGKPNPSAMNLQQDVLLKSETSSSHGRRRSSRQIESFPKSDNTESDISSKEDKDSSECNNNSNHGNSKLIQGEKPLTTACIQDFHSNSCQFDADSVNKKSFPSLEPKESSKEETVKKWIEDSSKIFSKSTESSEDDIIGKENEDQVCAEENMVLQDEKPPKRGRRSKGNKITEKNCKIKMEESDHEYDSKCIVGNVRSCDQSHDNNNNSCGKDNTSCEKEQSTDNSQLLSDFCTIVENVHKLKAETEKETNNNIGAESNKELPTSPTKETERPPKHKRTGEKHKRKISQSNSDYYKSPKKEKRISPRLEYNVDFMSDLSSALAEKDAVERIVIMQSRMNAMRKLYCKLRSEVASIDRRKRRKLRKQLENKPRGCT